MNRPQVVSSQEWAAARAALLVKEKEHTRALDALAAERRRLPMVALDAGKYRFTAPDGTVAGLADLFEGHRQLIIYHFMLEPGQDWTCGGCASFTDNIADQSHLNARSTRLILVARAPVLSGLRPGRLVAGPPDPEPEPPEPGQERAAAGAERPEQVPP